MICIVTALFSEAEALIAYYKLKKVKNNIFLIFANNDIFLIISGIGKINAAIATTYACTTNKIDKIYNIGICGSNDQDKHIGSLHPIKTIVEYDTNKKFIISDKGETVYCVSKPVNKINTFKKILVDMESVGFYNASKKFIQKENIYILKIISDFLDTSILPKKAVYDLVKKNIKNIKIS